MRVKEEDYQILIFSKERQSKVYYLFQWKSLDKKKNKGEAQPQFTNRK